MNIGCMILIYKINIVIILKVIYSDIIIFIKIINLFLMFKLKLNRNNVVYV